MATFKTRARTLDMLGRQQIAGIPTAISELFKNAHDAYAGRAEIDYYRHRDLFVMRDDGVGMSQDDFEERWLTLGTESKLDASKSPPQSPDKPPRPMLGEKGIGRLAIATIGPQLLVLTRAKAENGSSKLTAAFLNWRVFEWPGVNIEDVRVPVRSFRGDALPSALDVADMVEEFREGARRAANGAAPGLQEELAEELSRFDIDPQEIESRLREPALNGAGSGTHFIIKPVSPLLADDIDAEAAAGRANGAGGAAPLMKTLLGFSNTMTSEAQPPMRTAFWDHKRGEMPLDLLAEDEFFTPKEFDSVDHQITGTFDEFGQFCGDVSIYGEKESDRVIPWTEGGGGKTQCGSFTIRLAAFEGESRHSIMEREDRARLARKTEHLGGLYIYRNGIRVLPYGGTDYDWLGIEHRRTKRAGFFYFAHRKMFGAVDLDVERNRHLHEKAGREGFQENKAYRQFRSILRNFFLQAAADFFRAGRGELKTYDLRKSELSREDQARKQRAKYASEESRGFEERLSWFFERYRENKPEKEVEVLIERLAAELQEIGSMPDRHLAAQKLLEIEHIGHSEIRSLESKYRIFRPRVGLTKASYRDWGIYNAQYASLQDEVFSRARVMLDEMVGKAAREGQLPLDLGARAEVMLNVIGEEARRTTGRSADDLTTEADRVASETKTLAGQSLKEVEAELSDALSEIRRGISCGMSKEDFAQTRERLESRVLGVIDQKEALLHSALEQLKAVEVTGKKISAREQLMAIEQRNMLLEEEAETSAQLAQLGMAIEIINHEFCSTIRSIRFCLRELKAWADLNKGLVGLHNKMRASFDHLDGYLTLFTPLHRRLYRKEVEISGSEIRTFLKDLFRTRLGRHGVSFVSTEAFDAAKVTGYPSSFYPVFVNLVDNAIFWLSQQNPNLERAIRLDERDGALLVSDTGPGIDARDREAIFEIGFSRKPGGSGLGLHIGRKTLHSVGFDLRVIEGTQGATFGIAPIKTR